MSQPVKVLIVEDEVIVAMAMQMELSANGYTVCGIAATIEKAMTLFNEHAPEIILLDVNLSGSDDGINMALELRRTNQVPIVFLTGYADSEVLARIAKISHSTHLVKPADIGRIQSAVDLLLAN